MGLVQYESSDDDEEEVQEQPQVKVSFQEQPQKQTSGIPRVSVLTMQSSVGGDIK
jgi:hypothetical protein